MDHFGLILPAGITAIPVIGAVLFIATVLLIPGTLLLTMLQRLGVNKSGSKRRVQTYVLAKKILSVLLYHAFILAIMIFTWPQLINPIHTGYDVLGVTYIMIVLLLWTGTGMITIYGWNIVQGKDVKLPGIGFFIRLFLWHAVVFFVSRQLLYLIVT